MFLFAFILLLLLTERRQLQAHDPSETFFAAGFATGNVTVNTGATLIISGTGSIQVDGSFDNAGLVTNNGSITVGP